MNNILNDNHRASAGRGSSAGFTLIELLVAIALFLVIAGASLSLFNQDQPVFNRQQNLSALNITMRNAASQLQLDLVNAGANYYTGIAIPNWPVGVMIVNNTAGADCETSSTTYIYGSTCFDTLNVVATDSNTPPANPGNGAGGCALTTTTSTYLDPAALASYSTLATAITAAANYKSGDEVLFVKNDGSQYTAVVLTAAGSAVKVGSAYYVLLTHGATAANGANSSTANDPLQITVNQDTTAGTYQNTMLGDQFCSNDFVLRLNAIQYSVDVSTPSDPKLVRTQNGTAATVAEQIIGFKVGATLWNGGTATDTTKYDFKNSDYLNNYTLVRSVMVSLIGRTTPVTDPTFIFRNSFDTGPYQVQGLSLVVDPRNMSMND